MELRSETARRAWRSRGSLGLAVVWISVQVGAAAPATNLGTVEFENSGYAAAQEPFHRGLALLHCFEYDDAVESFRRAQELDPAFAMAYWGEALSHYHPLWGKEDRDASRAVLRRLAPDADARSGLAGSARERSYLGALEVLIGEGPLADRERAYQRAMADLARQYPDDEDAAALHALTLQAGRPSGQLGAQSAMRSAAILEELIDRHPDHPGVLHYLIHAYDDSVHASLGLRPARTFAQVAPSAAHALHMPSHIFLQLGMWREAAASDEESFQATEDRIRRKALSNDHRNFHSLSWAHYAYLQMGRVEDARRALGVAAETAEEVGSDRIRHARDAMLARHLIDGGGELDPGFVDASRLGGDLSDAEPIVALAVGLASAASGDRARSRLALARLRASAERAGAEGDRRRQSEGEIMALCVDGQLRLSRGDQRGGLDRLREAAEIEAAADLGAGPPRPAKSALELHGEVLLSLGRPAEAETEFERALLRMPNRSRSLLGAARAAAALGDRELARQRYARLLVNWSEADVETPALAEARAAAGSAAAATAEPVGS